MKLIKTNLCLMMNLQIKRVNIMYKKEKSHSD